MGAIYLLLMVKNWCLAETPLKKRSLCVALNQCQNRVLGWIPRKQTVTFCVKSWFSHLGGPGVISHSRLRSKRAPPDFDHFRPRFMLGFVGVARVSLVSCGRIFFSRHLTPPFFYLALSYFGRGGGWGQELRRRDVTDRTHRKWICADCCTDH